MQETMKAIAKTEAGKGVSLIELPVPKPEGNEVLIKVEYSAICGTDIHLYHWNPCATGFLTGRPFPAVIGHEMAGTVVAVGGNVDKKWIGQRVAFETHLHCGE
ncbi:MAG: L-threonine 3-dehydrogenase, partial [Clostridia bacterium]|nr:L-threonine 3-dehydrogenase [Clostridia bacterium]